MVTDHANASGKRKGVIRIELDPRTSAASARKREGGKVKPGPKVEPETSGIPPWWEPGTLFVRHDLTPETIDDIVDMVGARQRSAEPGPDRILLSGPHGIDLAAVPALQNKLLESGFDLPIGFEVDLGDDDA